MRIAFAMGDWLDHWWLQNDSVTCTRPKISNYPSGE
jgi:hypothetical protein